MTKTMEAKRILDLSRGGSIGGSQRQLDYVLANLDRKVYEPIVVCSKNGRFVNYLLNSRVRTYVLPLSPWRKFPSALYRYADAERLTRFARGHKVALAHSSDLWLSGYLIWLARRLKVPSVLMSVPQSARSRCASTAAGTSRLSSPFPAA